MYSAPYGDTAPAHAAAKRRLTLNLSFAGLGRAEVAASAPPALPVLLKYGPVNKSSTEKKRATGDGE